MRTRRRTVGLPQAMAAAAIFALAQRLIVETGEVSTPAPTQIAFRRSDLEPQASELGGHGNQDTPCRIAISRAEAGKIESRICKGRDAGHGCHMTASAALAVFGGTYLEQQQRPLRITPQPHHAIPQQAFMLMYFGGLRKRFRELP
jgi:hypothetical protein